MVTEETYSTVEIERVMKGENVQNFFYYFLFNILKDNQYETQEFTSYSCEDQKVSEMWKRLKYCLLKTIVKPPE